MAIVAAQAAIATSVHRVMSPPRPDLACILRPMSARPKDKPETRDSVSLVVALTLVALGAGGILAVFSGPLFALVTH
jgi:hypothetical protein